METYEYCVVVTQHAKADIAAEALTKLGRKGFRVISTKSDGGYIVWTLERAVETYE